MKIGLISDTHDNLIKFKKAVKLFNSKKVELVLHAGDYIAPFTIRFLQQLKCEYLGVLGNNDGDKEALKVKSGGRIKKGPLRLNKAGKKILLVHALNGVDFKNFDVVIFGHSHKKELLRQGQALLINPGECSGWLTDKSSVAVLDTDTLSVSFFKL